jgi:hypothetical protein
MLCSVTGAMPECAVWIGPFVLCPSSYYLFFRDLDAVKSS